MPKSNKQKQCHTCANYVAPPDPIQLIREDLIRMEGKIDSINLMALEYQKKVNSIEKRVWAALMGTVSALGGAILSWVKH